jgi:hypothetical protein
MSNLHLGPQGDLLQIPTCIELHITGVAQIEKNHRSAKYDPIINDSPLIIGSNMQAACLSCPSFAEVMMVLVLSSQ